MSPHNAYEFYRRYLDLLNNRQFDELGELLHEQVTRNGIVVDRDQVIADIRHTTTEAVPDLVWTLRDVIAVDDRLAARLTDTGTPVGEWIGIRPTGGSFEIDETVFYRIRDGRIDDMWYVVDTMTAQRQLDS
ncbi:ester cyclase [Amycolatopsis sp. NPDC003731]